MNKKSGKVFNQRKGIEIIRTDFARHSYWISIL
jgi:hypothetical protein